jgi:uncharacterized membrane protein (DUF485 family)
MTPAEWRALIEAYLDGRLSAEAFMRRFIDAWRVANGAVPRPIAAMQGVVEAFEAEVAEAREEGAINDDAMREAARRARAELAGQADGGAATYDRMRTREEFRRFQAYMTGCAGFGCVIALIWFGLCILQIYYVSEWIQSATDWGAWPSAVLGFVLAFVPVIGNVLAFLGATQEGWPPWAAAIVFFAAPAATFFSGWSRWRRRG